MVEKLPCFNHRKTLFNAFKHCSLVSSFCLILLLDVMLINVSMFEIFFLYFLLKTFNYVSKEQCEMKSIPNLFFFPISIGSLHSVLFFKRIFGSLFSYFYSMVTQCLFVYPFDPKTSHYLVICTKN